jgi:hypothetical protein
MAIAAVVAVAIVIAVAVADVAVDSLMKTHGCKKL